MSISNILKPNNLTVYGDVGGFTYIDTSREPGSGQHILSNQNTDWRWAIGLGNTETGSNIGSDLYIWRYADNEDLLGTGIIINRATGVARFNQGIQFLSGTGKVLTNYASASITASWTGPWVSGQTAKIGFERIGNVCTMYIQGIGVGAVDSATEITQSVPIPAGFMPIEDSVNIINMPFNITTNTGTVAGQLRINTHDFAMNVRTLGAIPGTGSIGFNTQYFTYLCIDPALESELAEVSVTGESIPVAEPVDEEIVDLTESMVKNEIIEHYLDDDDFTTVSQ